MARATTTAGSVADLYLQTYDRIDPSDNDYADRKTVLLTLLTQAHAYIYNFREWGFTFEEGVIAFTAGQNSSPLPDDFGEISRQGGLWYDTTRRIRMIERQPYLIQRMRQGTQPILYNVYSIFEEAFQLPYTAPSALSMPIFYRKRCESPLVTGSVLLIPDQYIPTVILPALVPPGQRSKNDARPDWKALLGSGLAQMCALERPMKNEDVELPMYREYGAW